LLYFFVGLENRGANPLRISFFVGHEKTSHQFDGLTTNSPPKQDHSGPDPGIMERAMGIESTSEAWKALDKTLKAIDLAALSFRSDDLNWKLGGN
jgi:hypothetical protein